MSGPPKTDHDQIMARAVMLPITDFKPGTPRLDGREARLKAMISNMETQDRQVRNRMFSATFAPDAIRANETHPDISVQANPEVIAALDSLRRCKAYNTRAGESRQFLVDTLKKYDGSTDTYAAGPRRSSAGVAPVAPMMGAPPPPPPSATMDAAAVRKTVTPTAPMMTTPSTSTPAPALALASNRPPTISSSTIDASRDPRRR